MNEFAPRTRATGEDEMTRFVADLSRRGRHPKNEATPQQIGDAISQAAHEADEANADDPSLLERLRKHGELQILLGLMAVGGLTVFLNSEIGQEVLRKLQGH